jgi:hypothetical protein
MSARIAPYSFLAVLLISATVLGSGCSKEKSAVTTALPVAEQMAGPVIGELAKAVPGLSQVSAALGAGSMLGLAQDKMPADQFSKLSSGIPGTNQLITDATAKGLPRPLNSLQDVTTFLGKNGFTPDQINKFVPAFSKEVSKLVPADVASAFAASLK